MNHKVKGQAGIVWIFYLSIVLAFTGLTGCGRQELEFYTDEELAETSGSEGKDKNVGKQENDVSGKELQDGDSAEADSQEKAGAAAETVQAGTEDSTADAGGVTVTQEPARIFVDVCGAVARPGVYELAADSRVFQAIELAGGYLPEAAGNYLNRASLLSDGQQIYVPTQTELDENPEKFSSEIAGAASGAGTSAGTVSGQAADASSGQSTESASGATLVDLNTADETELTTLTGIGASKAQAIIAYREVNGPFAAIEDLMKVDGIKEGTFAKIKDKITVS